MMLRKIIILASCVALTLVSVQSFASENKRSRSDSVQIERPYKKSKINHCHQSTIKAAEKLFDTLAADQEVYKKCDLSSRYDYIDSEKFLEDISLFRQQHKGKLRPLKHFIDFLFNGENGINKAEIKKVYRLLNEDIEGFITYLLKNNFALYKLNSFDIKQTETNIHGVIDRYVYFIRLLFLTLEQNSSDDFSEVEDITNDEDFVYTQPYVFMCANRFFDYCFRSDSFEKFKKRTNKPTCYPVLRLMYSTMSESFVRLGWKDWSNECLVALKRKADEGKRICYIAGGCDIYTLIDEGIYNITIIDPFFPTQNDFYSPDWEWLVNGSIGDEIEFKNNDVKLKRTSFNKGTTIWTVVDTVSNSNIGTIVLERRLCNVSDFKKDDNIVHLMSFNELFFISIRKDAGGWGLDHSKISKDLQLFIKQLHEPIDKDCIVNIRKAYNTKFHFCNLGANVD